MVKVWSPSNYEIANVHFWSKCGGMQKMKLRPKLKSEKPRHFEVWGDFGICASWFCSMKFQTSNSLKAHTIKLLHFEGLAHPATVSFHMHS